jgi:hypothetical protein
MNLLYDLGTNKEMSSIENQVKSPLRGWLCNHGSESYDKFKQLEIRGFKMPLLFTAETPMKQFVAYIDHQDKFSVQDKLSQVMVTFYAILSNYACIFFLGKLSSTITKHCQLWIFKKRTFFWKNFNSCSLV